MSDDPRLRVLNAKITSCSSHETPLVQPEKRHLDSWGVYNRPVSLSLFLPLPLHLHLSLHLSLTLHSTRPPALMAAAVTENPLLRGLVDIGR